MTNTPCPALSSRPARRRPGLALAGLATLAALTVAGCSGGGSGGLPSIPGLGEATPKPAQVADDLVPGLQHAMFRAKGIEADVPSDPAGLRTLSVGAENVINKALRNRLQSDGTDFRSSWRLIGASPDVVGLEMSISQKVNGAESTSPAAIWYDGESGRAVASAGLIDRQQWGPFTDAVLRDLPENARSSYRAALADVAAPWGQGPALTFDDKGGLTVTFPRGAGNAQPQQAELHTTRPVAPTAPTLDGPASVTLPADTIDPLLSAFGRRAKEAALKPSAFDASRKPGATPSPTAAPSSNSSASPSASPGQTRAEDPTALGPVAGTENPSADPTASPSTDPGASPGSGASATPAAPQAVRPSPVVGVDCRIYECFAYTLDDGPGEYSQQLISAVKKTNGALSLFQIGKNVTALPEVTRREAAAGLEINAHSWDHPSLTKLSGAALQKQLVGPIDAIKKVTGRAPLFMRPPYGARSDDTDAAVGKVHQVAIDWDVDTLDWKKTATAANNIKVAVGESRAGSMTLMHEIHPHSAEAVLPILEGTLKKGLYPVTVGELSMTSGFRPGHSYCVGHPRNERNTLCHP